MSLDLHSVQAEVRPPSGQGEGGAAHADESNWDRNTLLFSADLFLATPGTALSHGLNPHEALKHVSSLHASYQDELLRLREVLAEFTMEEVGVDEFVAEWRVMKAVDEGKEVELGELNDIMGSWGTVDSEMK